MRADKICGLLAAVVVLIIVGHLVTMSMAIAIKSGWPIQLDGPAVVAYQKQQDYQIPLNPQLLLNVPFYVYEELAWVNATMGGEPLLKMVTRRQKHALDYYWMMSSLKHPMRTNDPSKAKLFVVPLLLNMYSLRVYNARDPMNPFHNVSQYRNVTMCWNDMCDKTLLKYAGSVLNASSWFHRKEGRDHIVVTSHFGYRLKRQLRMPPSLRHAVFRCNAIGFEDRRYNDASRKSYPSILVGNVCPYEPEKTHQVSFIGTLKDPSEIHYHDRQKICRWILEMNQTSEIETNTGSSSSPTSNQSSSLTLVSICGKGVQCPALAQARFGFHVRGDTFGSQRLMDALLSGTVPLFTRMEQYQIVPPWINWTKISYFVNLTDQRTFHRSLKRIMDAPSLEYDQRHQAVVSNRDLFDWTTMIPFDTYMYMLQADLYPETRHPSNMSNRYSALLLP
jgi:hypothetical protein